MIRQTSIQSYEQLLDSNIGFRQQKVLNGFVKFGDSTDLEMKEFLHFGDANMIRPRRNELYKLGLLECKGKRECFISKRKVMVWGLK